MTNLENASETHYLVKNTGVTREGVQLWRKTCRNFGIPFILIQKHSSTYYSLEFDGDPVFDYSSSIKFIEAHSHPVQPDLAPTTELRAKLDEIMERYPHIGGWSSGGIDIHHLTLEQAEDIARSLVALWDEAKYHPDNNPYTMPPLQEV